MLAAGIDVLSTVNVQHLESLNDQIAELTGVRVRETIPDAVLGRRRRGRDHRPHPRGAARPPARGQGVPGRADRGGAEQLLPDREPRRRCARSRCARSPRRSVTKRLAPAEPSSARARRRWPPRRRRRSASGCWRWSSPIPERSGSCAGPGARPSGSARDLDLLWVRPPGRVCPTSRSVRSTALRQLARCSARTCIVEESDDVAGGDRRRRAPAGEHLHPDGPQPPARAGSARLRTPLPQRLMELLPGRRRADRRRPRPAREADGR